MVGHLDPQFIKLMDKVNDQLRSCFQSKNKMTFPISGPGTAGMEACFANLVEPGDKVLVCRNGVFGERMRHMVQRLGGEPIIVDAEWGKPIDPADVERELKKSVGVKVVAAVHAETSTGVMSDVGAICALSRRYDALTIVDCVTSLGGVPVDVDGWQCDAVYSGTQKCLSAPPGLSPVSFSTRAVEHVKNRRTKVVSWFYDIGLLSEYWSGETKRTYHHTAPISMIYALHEALTALLEEGLSKSWSRHRTISSKLISGLEGLGLDVLVEPASRLPQLTVVKVPDGVNDSEIRTRLLDEFDLEIGGGLGQFAGKAWRIGLMGHGCTLDNVDYCLSSLGDCLRSPDSSK